MSALNLLRNAGKIRFLGVSNFSREQIQEAEKYGKIDVQQLQFSMVHPKHKALIEWGSKQGIDAFTYGSLGSGILSGKYRTLPEFKTRRYADYVLRLLQRTQILKNTETIGRDG